MVGDDGRRRTAISVANAGGGQSVAILSVDHCSCSFVDERGSASRSRSVVLVVSAERRGAARPAVRGWKVHGDHVMDAMELIEMRSDQFRRCLVVLAYQSKG